MILMKMMPVARAARAHSTTNHRKISWSQAEILSEKAAAVPVNWADFIASLVKHKAPSRCGTITKAS
jgi:hypothetical protein